MKDGPGGSPAGSATRLDCGASPGPVYRFTVSKSGRDSLRPDDATGSLGLSCAETGTIVHFRVEAAYRQLLLPPSRINAGSSFFRAT